MSTKLKICGIRQKNDIDIINKYDNIDYIGFVFAESPRKVSKEEAKYLSDLLSPNITCVGVFVDEDIENILELYKEKIIDIAQLHGNESKEYVKTLKKLSKEELGSEIEIIKVIEINDNLKKEEIVSKLDYDCDYFLFDSGKGSGKVFNWDLIDKSIINKKPFFLAGGLNETNLKEAISEFEPFAVDLSSGVETNKSKDELKIKRVVDLVK
ncbi:MAG: phosphoribosylanthranilate isomerase [archaeon]|nr:phosphoribosylanthranilate isomerase [archaeon]